ncbi:MAG: type IV pilus twitching motility protein PilT [Phycisphaerae bacterium]|nr:type IV pilus twitching motility protein PilT [Phycisphaerae bacterium]
MDRATLLQKAFELGASDIHLVPGHCPMFRINTLLQETDGYDRITPEDTAKMVVEMVGEKIFARLDENRDIDFATALSGVGRFRVNAHYQRGAIGIAFRAIPHDVPDIASLNLPEIVQDFYNLPRGLVLITGPTGSGKSTTLASLIDAMNKHYSRHVITLEDPIEYQINSRKSLIEQRELGFDVPSFASGLKHSLRQDPDVILVGEMRDLETTSAALTAAETGHLVLSTLHTQSAHQTLSRIIDIYPGEQQKQIRTMLSNTLQAVVTQTLFNKRDNSGMVPALEIMICNSAARNCIRDDRLHEIPNILETNRAAGMCTMDESIKNLIINGQINLEDGIARARNPEALHKVLGR